MNRSLAALFALTLIAPAAAQEKWLASYDEAVTAAKAEGKPIFLVFRCER